MSIEKNVLRDEIRIEQSKLRELENQLAELEDKELKGKIKKVPVSAIKELKNLYNQIDDKRAFKLDIDFFMDTDYRVFTDSQIDIYNNKNINQRLVELNKISKNLKNGVEKIAQKYQLDRRHIENIVLGKGFWE